MFSNYRTNFVFNGLLIVSALNFMEWNAFPDEPKDGRAGEITNIPLTVEIKLDDKTRLLVERAMESDLPTPLNLSIQGVMPPAKGDSLAGIKIFLNNPKATAKTAADDPHFVTTVSLAPTTSKGKQDFSADIRPVLLVLKNRNQLDLSKPIKVTLAALPIDEDCRFPADFSVSVGKLTIAGSSSVQKK